MSLGPCSALNAAGAGRRGAAGGRTVDSTLLGQKIAERGSWCCLTYDKESLALGIVINELFKFGL